MGQTADDKRRPGRPRDDSIDAKVLQATTDLLVEGGFDATTVAAIAERAGVHVSAIYRRWSSRLDIVEEAVFPGVLPTTEPTGDLEHDLRRFVRAVAAAFGAPAFQAAMPRLLAAYPSRQSDGFVTGWSAVSSRPQFRAILAAAGAEPVQPRIDVDDVFDMLLGAIVARSLIPTVVRRHRPVERLVELTVQQLRIR